MPDRIGSDDVRSDRIRSRPTLAGGCEYVHDKPACAVGRMQRGKESKSHNLELKAAASRRHWGGAAGEKRPVNLLLEKGACKGPASLELCQ